MVRIKRVYDPPAAGDGFRVLVDRLWPRGLAKERAAVDLWLKQVAPSNELRRWFAHRPARWDGFRARYRAELAEPERAASLAPLRELAAGAETLTLLFGAREEKLNHAAFLRELLEGG